MTLLSETNHIESERLLLRRMVEADLEYFTRIHADADVARYIGSGQPRTPDETRVWLADILASYENASLGPLAVVRKSDGQLVGRCGLSDAAVERTPAAGALRRGWFFSAHVPPDIACDLEPELGYTFGKENWGQGYASEAAGCVYAYAMAARDFAKIMSVIHAENVRSRHVAQKFAVSYVDQINMLGRVFDRYHWPMDNSHQ